MKALAFLYVVGKSVIFFTSEKILLWFFLLPSFLPMEKSPAILILPLLKSNENSFITEKLSSFCKNTVVGRSVFFL